MNDVVARFTAADERFLLQTLAPDGGEPVLRAIREDTAIRDAMLADRRLFDRLANDVESVVLISPYLFFAILLARVAADLTERPYTVETEELHAAAVFDSQSVVDFMRQERIATYIVMMLASFVRLTSGTVGVVDSAGRFRRFRVNDLDVQSLIRLANAVDGSRQFDALRRIADACLFIVGFLAPTGWARLRMQPREYRVLGPKFYGLAAQHDVARHATLGETLAELGEHFHLAAKPLRAIASRYLHILTEHGLPQ